MPNIQDAAQQLNAALDRIAAAANNPQQVQQAVQDAKQKVQEFVQHAQQAGQGGQQGTTQQGQHQR